MSPYNHPNHGMPNLSNDNAHSSWSQSDQSWPILPRVPPLNTVLPTSNPSVPNNFPNNHFNPATSYEPLYSPSQQQQQTHPPSLTYSTHEQLSKASGQVQGGSDNSAPPSSSTADPVLLPPFDILGGGRCQAPPFYASHTDLQILSTSSGLYSPLSVDSASSFLQYQSIQSSASTYPTEDSPSQGAGTTVTVDNVHHQQPMAMVPTLFFPTTAQLPYASVSTFMSPVSHDLPTETPEPATTKKRKVKDARQISELNRVYSRTAYPSTGERQQLARDLDLTPRCVQVWFQNQRQKRGVGRNSASLPINRNTVALLPDTPPIAAHHRGSTPPVVSMGGSASADINPCTDGHWSGSSPGHQTKSLSPRPGTSIP